MFFMIYYAFLGDYVCVTHILFFEKYIILYIFWFATQYVAQVSCEHTVIILSQILSNRIISRNHNMIHIIFNILLWY